MAWWCGVQVTCVEARATRRVCSGIYNSAVPKKKSVKCFSFFFFIYFFQCEKLTNCWHCSALSADLTSEEKKSKHYNIVNKPWWVLFFSPSQFMWTRTTVGNMSDFEIISLQGMKKKKKQNKYISCSEGRMAGISSLEQAVLPSVVCYMQSEGHRHAHTFWKRCLATDTHRALLK